MGKNPGRPAVLITKRKRGYPRSLQLKDGLIQLTDRFRRLDAQLLEQRLIVIQRLRVPFDRQPVNMLVKGPQMQVTELMVQPVFLYKTGQIHQTVRSDVRLNLCAAEQYKHIGRGPGDHFTF
ncbi:hypothetical protein D3C76_1567980 [compost metagenome]